MNRITSVVLVAMAVGTPLAVAQRGQVERNDRRVARLVDDLREELWQFRQELEFFRRVPTYAQMIDLRFQLRNQAIELVEARDYNDPRTRQMAREMESEARDLYHLAEHLEDSLDPRNNPEVRRRADSLHEHAVEIRVIIGRLHEVIHLERENGPRGRPQPGPRDGGR